MGVSTLIRPSGRMQPGQIGMVIDWPCASFNPHPTFRPDATLFFRRRYHPWPGFNPHPTFRPDATRRGNLYLVQVKPVSTLIRPSGRMQPALPEIRPCGRSSFNPHPTFRPDATKHYDGKGDDDVQFQPSSDLQAGCNVRRSGDVIRVCHVSTLIRPSGRMQRGSCRWKPMPMCGFNPHPTFRPDATPEHRPDPASGSVSTLIRPSGRMQPSFGNSFIAKVGMFQPSSDLQAGCNRRDLHPADQRQPVSTLIRPSGRMQLRGERQHHQDVPQVSTLIRPSGRMQPVVPFIQCIRFTGFNPHPTFRPDATCRVAGVHCPARHVSTLIRPSGRMQLWMPR